MFFYWMGYETGINDSIEISNNVIDAASEPYKNNANDTSKFNQTRIESFKKPASDTVLPARFRTEKSVLQSSQN